MADILTDPLPRYDPKSQELAYNNWTDRMRMELPERGDPASSGCVAVITPSGTDSIPVYLTSPIHMEVNVDPQDTIKILNYNGGNNIPVYLSTHLDQSTDDVRVYSASGAVALDVHSVDIAHKESDPYASGLMGVPALAIRNDSIGALVDNNRDMANLQLSQWGGLRTQLDTVRDVSIDIGNGFADTGTIRVAVSSGVLNQERDNVRVYSASGTASLQSYFDGPVTATIPGIVEVKVDQANDSIRIYSASGTTNIPVYLQSDLDFNNDSVKAFNVSASGTNVIPIYGAGGTIQTVASDLDIRDISQSQDTIRIYSASGTNSIPVYAADEPIDVLEKNPAVLRRLENTWSQLTAPGITSPLYVMDYSKHTFQYKVASINTNVKVAASGSLDNTNWFNLDANDALSTHTSNGTYGMTFDGVVKYTLFSFMEETGGTSATVDVKYLGGN